MYKTFNKNIENNKSKNDWLSSDDQEVEKFEKDPFTGCLVSNQLIFETVKYMLQTSKLKNIKKMKSDLPIIIITGKDDAIGNYGKGIRHTGKLYKKDNIHNMTVHLYKNKRHELLYEKDATTEKQHMYDWIERQ